jgi:predicted ester cyclase
MEQTISAIRDTAEKFFEACESGEGWDGCRQYCRPDATFSAQAEALTGITTVEAYANWMKGMYTPMPNARYEVKSFAVDELRNNVAAFGVFRATHSAAGGPVAPTGKTVEADYVYVMDFDGGRIKHMTKIWNDGHTMKQVGWA